MNVLRLSQAKCYHAATADFAYFRWHGKGTRPWYNYRYEKEELEPWVSKVKEATEKVKTVYGYFNNHHHGYAVENCLQVLEMSSVLTHEQAEAKNRVEDYFKTSAAFKEPKIEVFVERVRAKHLRNLSVSFATRFLRRL